MSVTSASEDVQATLADGLQRGRRLDLTYDVATRDETTQRFVDPLRLFVLDGYGYLEAWCYRADGLRTFRLDRVAAASVTDEPVQPHDVVLTDLSAGLVRRPGRRARGHPRAGPRGGLGRGVLPDRVHGAARRTAAWSPRSA